jgi:hypothetical protein
MSPPSEATRSYSVRDLQRRQIDHFIAVMEQGRDDWRTIERFVSQGQLLPVWDRALLDDDRSIRFMLAIRQYCTMRNLEREYLDRGRRISHEARQAVSAELDLQFLLSLGEVAGDLENQT